MDNFPESAKDIEAIADNILKDSHTYDILPTPINKIIEFTNLHLDYSYILTRPDEKFIEKYGKKIASKFTSILNRVLGMLDLHEDVIYLDHTQIPGRKNFIKLHEVGHSVLTWQRKTFLYLDNKKTINPEVKNEFEREANYFSSSVLFQLDRFNREIIKQPLSLVSGKLLAEKFGASIHATLRRYIEKNPKRCAMLVLEDPMNPSKSYPKIRNYFQSPSFTKEFGELVWNDNMMIEMPFTILFFSNCRYKDNQSFMYRYNRNNIAFEYDYFHNTYNAFVFFKPVGEKTRSRRIISVKK